MGTFGGHLVRKKGGGEPIFCQFMPIARNLGVGIASFLPIFVYFCQCRTCYFEIVGMGISRSA